MASVQKEGVAHSWPCRSSPNWALGHLSATLVAVMAEPVGATLLAWLVLGEAPPLPTLGGGLLILAGVYLALRR